MRVKSLNKVLLMGRVGQDCELKYTPAGVAVVSFSIATNEFWKDGDGNKKERTEWHRVIAWRKLAEMCSSRIVKGALVYVDGQIRSRKYTNKEKVEKTMYEIFADEIQILVTPVASAEKKTDTDHVPF